MLYKNNDKVLHCNKVIESKQNNYSKWFVN